MEPLALPNVSLVINGTPHSLAELQRLGYYIQVSQDGGTITLSLSPDKPRDTHTDRTFADRVIECLTTTALNANVGPMHYPRGKEKAQWKTERERYKKKASMRHGFR